MRTCAKTNSDDVIAGEVNHCDTFGLCVHRTDVGVVVKVDGKPKAFEGDVFKEIAIPQLESD